MILYKEEQLAYDFVQADWRLVPLLAAVEEEARQRSCGVRVTCVFRLDGIHGAGRAFDNGFFDIMNYTRNYDVGPVIEKAINTHTVYGLGHDGQDRPAALWHDSGTGLHLHVQVPDHDLILKQ